MNKLNKPIDLSKIYNNKLIQIIINILFSISTASLTAILIVGDFSTPVIDILLPTFSFAIMLFITLKFKLLNRIFTNTNKVILIISAVLGVYAIYLTSQFMLDYSTTFYNVIFLILAIPSAITFLYWFYAKLLYYGKLLIKSLDKLEKIFLIVSVSIFSVIIIVSYNITTIFTEAYMPEQKRNYNLVYDVQNEETLEKGKEFVEKTFSFFSGNLLYTFDTQVLLATDVYNNINAPENDIRQPFFGIFALPFTILPKLISQFTFTGVYYFLIAIVQGILISISIILLEKLMKLKGLSKILFMIFLSVTYPTLLFMLNMEQYVIPVFYLITFIYMSINNMKDKNLLYIMSTGSLLTSGILFPLLGNTKNFKKSIVNILYTFILFVVIAVLSAKILLISPVKLENQVDTFSNFMQNDKSTLEHINMYTNFLQNTIIAPETEVTETIFARQILTLNNLQYHLVAYSPNLNQANNTNVNIFGIAVLIIVFLGFILNKKDSFSKICFAWVLFSIVLLVIFGYGAFENGFILYAYYFSWAFVCLLFKFFETVLQKWPKVKNTIYALAIIPVAVINFYGIYQLIEFGLQYYC